MRNRVRWSLGAVAVAGLVLGSGPGAGLNGQVTTRADTLGAVRRIMEAARFAAFVTVDEAGQPNSRIVDPFAPDSQMSVWIGTNPRTRKVAHIQREPRVALTYYDGPGFAYVTLIGRAVIVDDPQEKEARFKPEWAALYPDRARDYLLIRVDPVRLEMFSNRDRIGPPDSLTWRPAMVHF